MDMVARLLNILPAAKKQSPKETATLERRSKRLICEDGWIPPPFDPNCVRLVLYWDHEGRGKIQIFDTKVHLSTSNTDTDNTHMNSPSSTSSLTQSLRNDDSFTSSITSSLGTSLRSRPPLTKRHSSDSELLGEMMFGSMPMKLMGNSVKIHYIRSEEQLMLTKVFYTHRRMMSSCSLNDFSESCPLPGNMSSQVIDHLGHIPKQHSFHYSLRPPSSSPDSVPKSHSLSQSHLSPYASPTASLPLSLANSGNHDFSPTHSLTQGVPPTSSLTSSLTRRLQRIRSTSFENGSELYHRILKPMDQSSSTKRGRKYAVGIIFSLADMKPQERKQFQEFFFSHFTLINSNLEQLREKIEESLWNRRHMTELVMKAYQNFVEDFKALYCAQRIKAPIWLEIVGSSSNRRDVCKRFLSELSSLVAQLDSKDTKFFLSSLLTAVLSYHLAWVYTVSKSGSNTSRHHDRMASKSLAVLANSHPYNPLWAQFGDLCGAVSDPLTVCRTIVVGKSSSLVRRLLYLLTYFIRCSEIEEQGMFKHVIDSHLHLQGQDLEESSIFPQESRAGSALTLLSEGGQSSTQPSLMTSGSLERSEGLAPLVKPHPFSFSQTNSLSHPSSCSGSTTELRQNLVTQSCGSLDHHVTGFTFDFYHQPVPIPSYSKPQTAAMCQSVPVDVLSRHNHSPLTPFTSYHLSRRSSGDSLTRKPFLSTKYTAPIDSGTSDNDTLPQTTSHCECHYQPKENCCASHAEFDSLGMCPIDTQKVIWKPGGKQTHHSIHDPPSPPPGDSNWYYSGSYHDTNNKTSTDITLPACSNSYPKTTTTNGSIEPVSKINTDSSNESLSTGYQTLSRNASGTSLGASFPTQNPSVFAGPLKTVRHHGTCGSCDSGVFEHASIVTADSGRFTDMDSLQFSVFSAGGSLHGKPDSSVRPARTSQSSSIFKSEVDSYSQPNQSQYADVMPEASLRQMPRSTNNSDSLTEFESSHGRSRSGAFCFSRNQKSLAQEDICDAPRCSSLSPVESIALSHDQLHTAHIRRMSPDKVHFIPGVTIGQPVVSSQHHLRLNEGLSQSYDSRYVAHRSHVQSTCTGLYNSQTHTNIHSPHRTMSQYNSFVSPHGTSKFMPSTLTSSYDHNHHNSLSTRPPLLTHNKSLASNLPEPTTVRCSSSPSLLSLVRPPAVNIAESPQSYKGLPLIEGACPELESNHDGCSWYGEHEEGGLEITRLKVDHPYINVEESLSPLSLSHFSTSPLSRTMEGEKSGMRFEQQFKDFSRVDISNLDDDFAHELPLSPPPIPTPSYPTSANSTPHLAYLSRSPPSLHSLPSTTTLSTHSSGLSDFGHSLMAGCSSQYMPHFVLHGTSQPFTDFKDKLISDLSSMVKYSIVDEPVQHGVAIIADTDTFTCKIVAVSKSKRTNDGEVLVGTAQSAYSVQQLIHSVATLWDMQMPPEFCLSHMEDGLMELNEQGHILSTGLLEQGHISDLSNSLQKLHNALNTNLSDGLLLQALAGVHASSTDPNISKELQTLCLHSLVT